METENNLNISWGVHKDFEGIVRSLTILLPDSGEVEGEDNKSLEKFRKASNVIYDIYNNGLCNRGRELRVLGLTKADISDYPPRYGFVVHPKDEVIWEAFRPIVIDAVDEQFSRVLSS